MSITCEICGSHLNDDGSFIDEKEYGWCNTCEDESPRDDSGMCARCGNDPDDDGEDY